MMLADYHVHTNFSDDSFYEMEAVVKDAIGLGLSEICFTDHVDYGIKEDWDSHSTLPYRDGKPLANVNYPLYEKAIKAMQATYGDQITIKFGLEFGMQEHTISQYQRLFHTYPFDFIILSVHEVDNLEFWNQDFQRGRTQEEYQKRYYQALLNLVKTYKDYSVLGHMDLIVRYDQQSRYPFEEIRPMVEEILRQVIADGKGIEVNTSSHGYGLADLTPSRHILRLYKELGGRVITIGSDSHTPKDLGAYIGETQRVLKALGFTEYCTFSQMKPTFHPLG